MTRDATPRHRLVLHVMAGHRSRHSRHRTDVRDINYIRLDDGWWNTEALPNIGRTTMRDLVDWGLAEVRQTQTWHRIYRLTEAGRTWAKDDLGSGWEVIAE